MPRYKTAIFLFLILSSFVFSAMSQNCNGFHSEYCKPYDDKTYNEYGKSRSALTIVNIPSYARIVCYGGKDYKLIFCTKDNKYPVHYIIKNIENNEVLYDNIIDDYIESVGFTVDKTQSFLIEMTVISDEKTDFENIEHRLCLGLQILWRKVGDLGFEKQP